MQQGCVCGSQGSRDAVFVLCADGVAGDGSVLRFYVPSGEVWLSYGSQKFGLGSQAKSSGYS